MIAASTEDTTMKFSNDKQIANHVRTLVRLGWRFQHGGRHGKLISPCGHKFAVPNSPSDYRAFQNFKHDLRKLTHF